MRISMKSVTMRENMEKESCKKKKQKKLFKQYQVRTFILEVLLFPFFN